MNEQQFSWPICDARFLIKINKIINFLIVNCHT